MKSPRLENSYFCSNKLKYLYEPNTCIVSFASEPLECEGLIKRQSQQPAGSLTPHSILKEFASEKMLDLVKLLRPLSITIDNVNLNTICEYDGT